MHCPQCIVNVYIHETNGKGRKITSWWWLRWWLTGPSIATQSKNRRSCRNSPVTSLIRPSKIFENCMILLKKLPPSNFQFSKIITESFSSTFLSNNEVWFWEMMDLDSNGLGTKIDTDSGIWLISSRDSKVRVKLIQKWGPNQRIDVHTFSLSMKCDHKILVIQFHSVLVHDSMLTPE